MNQYGNQINLNPGGQGQPSRFRNGPRFRNAPWSRMTQPASPLIGPQFNNWTPIHQPSGSGWHAEVNNELREHLVNKFVNAVFPEGKQTNFPSNDDRIDR